MYSSLVVLATTIACISAQQTTPNLPQVTAAPASLSLGAVCSTSVQCAGGAACYGTTAFTIRTCGSFNAACTSDDQCATNTCQSGTCSGFLATSLYKRPSPTPASSSAPATSTPASGIQPAPSSTVVAAPGSLPLGAECATTEQCDNAECFASNAWGIKACGKFNAACTSDANCSTNTCQNGICSGFLATSLYKLPHRSSTTSAAAGTATGAPTTPTLPQVTAAAGSLGLGAVCSDSTQCAGGAACYGTTAFTIRTCGSFNAACTSDNQCATNTCQSGTCSGFLATSLYKRPSSTAAAPAQTPAPTGNSTVPATSARPSNTVFPGAAGRVQVGGAGVLAAAAAVAAWVLV